MRHVGGVLIGLVGTTLGVSAIGYGLGIVTRGLVLFQVSSAYLGAPLMLVGGLLLGLVLVGARLSRWAPVSSGLALLAASGYALAAPGALVPSGLGGGIGQFFSTQLGLALGMLMLGGALAVRGRRRPPPGGQQDPPPSQQYPPPGQQY